MGGCSQHCTGGVDQNHPQGKEMEKRKMILWGGLVTIDERWRGTKGGKGEKERYTHLNAEFQRIAKRYKKVNKEMDENSRMGKTRDLFKKVRDTKGKIHEKMGKRKDRNGMDLTEADDIKKRWQKYTEELYKKFLVSQITTMVWSLS